MFTENDNEGLSSFMLYTCSGHGCVMYPEISEKEMKLIQISSGNAYVQIGAEAFEAGEGDIFYIPPRLVHRVDALGKEDITVRVIVFNVAILTENMDRFDKDVFSLFNVQSQNNAEKFSPGNIIYDKLNKCIAESYYESASRDVCYRLPIKAGIYMCMTEILRYYGFGKGENARVAFHNLLRLKPTLDHIENNYMKKIYVADLAELMFVSEDYFAKMFKECIGKTPIEYINGIRINQALRFLVRTETSISDISNAVGFGDSNYMSKIFKQKLLMSPIAYRKAVRERMRAKIQEPDRT